MTGEEIALKYVGVPFKHAGRGPDGVDCLGLLIFVYRDLGVEMPQGDGREYSQDWYDEEPDRYLQGLLTLGESVVLPLQPFDLVYFRIYNDAITHGGVMIDDQRFIHVTQGRSVMLSRMAGYWQRKFAGARRLI